MTNAQLKMAKWALEGGTFGEEVHTFFARATEMTSPDEVYPTATHSIQTVGFYDGFYIASWALVVADSEGNVLEYLNSDDEADCESDDYDEVATWIAQYPTYPLMG